jgi:peptidoglycan hydrolase-like protein with peptidoglycan-binding domain
MNKMYWKKTLTTIKQYAFPRTAALERELSAARAENEAVSAALASTRAEFDSTRARDAQQIMELDRQRGLLEAEHRAVQQQARRLEESLQEANRRQQHAEQQIGALQDRLEEEHTQHESSLNTTRETLDQLQTRQQELLSLQSSLARTFNEFGKQLLEAMPLDVAQPKRPKLPLLPLVAIASLLFLAVLLVGAVTVRGFQDSTRVLSDASQGIRDLQVAIKYHIGKQDELLLELTEALNRNNVRTIVPPADAAGAAGTRQDAVDRTGPPLLLPDAAAEQPAGVLLFDPQVKTLQTDLMALGFNIGQPHADGLRGPLTQRALEEFQTLYFPLTGLAETPDDAQLAVAVSNYAAQAREDEQRFRVDSGVLAAIRLASLRTGVEFAFLMELAAVESTFDPSSRASGSSAAGLYQFKGSTWLEAVRIHGAKYGIGTYAEQVEYVVNTDGQRRPVIHDPQVAEHVLDLRYNPRVAALLAAEHVRKNMRRLSYSLDREPGRTELYLSHFLGTTGAISFLRVLDEEPDEIAGDIFPAAARRNRNIFHAGQSKQRTVAEVYEIFSRKFNTARYAEGNPG